MISESGLIWRLGAASHRTPAYATNLGSEQGGNAGPWLDNDELSIEVLETVPITPDMPELLAVAKLFGLQVF